MRAFKGIITCASLLVAIEGNAQWTYQRTFDSLFARGEYKILLEQLSKQEKTSPEKEQVLRGIGYVHIALKNYEEGERYYLGALKVNPRCAKCYLNLGRIHAIKGDYTRALHYLDKAVETDPADGVAYSFRGVIKESTGDKFRAQLDHNKAVAVSPSNAEVYFQRGLYYKNQNYDSKAIEDFSSAIALDSMRYGALTERAAAYYYQKRYDEAFTDISRAIAIDTGKPEAYLGRGALYEVRGELKNALADYSKVIAMNPDDPVAYMNRAKCRYRMERPDEACEDYLAAQSVNQRLNDPDPSLGRDAVIAIREYCDSGEASYYYQRGIAYYNLKEYEKALAIYARGLKRFPEHSLMISFQGNAYLALEMYREAIASYSLSLRLKENIIREIDANPRTSEMSAKEKTDYVKGAVASSLYSIAEAQAHLGFFDEALYHVTEAIDAAPKITAFSLESYYNLRGFICTEQGKNDLALADFDRSISINDNVPTVYVNRAIARANKALKPKRSARGVSARYNTVLMQTNWPVSARTGRSEEPFLVAAMEDCNKALAIDADFAYAYLVRGQLKKMLSHGDHCMDLVKARSLGLEAEDNWMKGCR